MFIDFEVDQLSLKVLGTDGDSNLGGQDLTNLLVQYFIEKLEKNNNNNDNKSTVYQNTIQRLRAECERIKRKLIFIKQR